MYVLSLVKAVASICRMRSADTPYSSASSCSVGLVVGHPATAQDVLAACIEAGHGRGQPVTHIRIPLRVLGLFGRIRSGAGRYSDGP